MQERQRLMGRPRRLARAVPGDHDRWPRWPYAPAGSASTGTPAAVTSWSSRSGAVGALRLGLTRQEQIRRARGIGQEPARITFGLLPDGTFSRAADAPKDCLDLVLDLSVGLALRFEQIGADIGRGIAVAHRDEGRRHHVHADQHGIEPAGEATRGLQARLERAVISDSTRIVR